MKQFLSTLILLPSLALACDMERATSETQFVIDPSSGRVKQESKTNNAKFEVSRCTPDEKYLLINFNSIYYQDDTSRLESIAGNLVQKTSNCSIKSEIPFQTTDVNFLQSIIQQRHNFLRKCVRLVFSDQRGQKIQTHPQSQCQLKNLDATGAVVETDGSGCLIAMNSNSKISVESKINPDCLQSSFLTQNQIQAQDVESVIKLWPVAEEAGKLLPMSPIGARYVRHTILPAQGFMPRAVKEDQNQFPFISVISTNISAGNISLSSMGRNIVQIQPTFLVENISKEFCQNDQCARPSSFMTPISGMLTLTKINLPNGKKQQIGEWSHSLKVPANWTGMAEFKNENNLTGLTMGALNANMTLNPGDEFELLAKFYEPRSLLDELSYTQSFFDINNNLSIDGGGDENLPSLPKVGELGRLDKIPQLPSIALGRSGILELSDRFNMTRNWTQKYDRVCDSQNRNCQKLNGIDKPFVIIKMQFKIGENKEVIAEKVSKDSSVFGSYEQQVQNFAKKVCE